MLTAGALELMRGRIEDTFDQTCVVVREAGTAVSDGMGGFNAGTTAAGTYTCRIAPTIRLPIEALTADQVQSIGTHIVTLPALTDVRPSDRIVSGTRTFSVTGGTGDRSYELSKRVLCTEINEGEGS